jgi:hypothetical protein
MRAGKPCGQLLDDLQLERRGPLVVAFLGDVEHAVLTIGAVIPHLKFDQLPDAAAGIGQHGDHGRVTHTPGLAPQAAQACGTDSPNPPQIRCKSRSFRSGWKGQPRILDRNAIASPD